MKLLGSIWFPPLSPPPLLRRRPIASLNKIIYSEGGSGYHVPRGRMGVVLTLCRIVSAGVCVCSPPSPGDCVLRNVQPYHAGVARDGRDRLRREFRHVLEPFHPRDQPGRAHQPDSEGDGHPPATLVTAVSRMREGVCAGSPHV